MSPDIRREIWQKFVFWSAFRDHDHDTPTDGPIRENAQTRAFLLDVMRGGGGGARPRVDLPADYAEQRLALADDGPTI